MHITCPPGIPLIAAAAAVAVAAAAAAAPGQHCSQPPPRPHQRAHVKGQAGGAGCQSPAAQLGAGARGATPHRTPAFPQSVAGNQGKATVTKQNYTVSCRKQVEMRCTATCTSKAARCKQYWACMVCKHQHSPTWSSSGCCTRRSCSCCLPATASAPLLPAAGAAGTI